MTKEFIEKDLVDSQDEDSEEEFHPVYEPREDSFLLQRNIQSYLTAKSKVLDVGTGSGIQAEEAVKYSSDVTGVDINPAAIRVCKMAHKNKSINFFESDLFTSPKLQGKKFDFITFNAPYLPDDPNLKDKALFGGKHGYELTVKFIKQLNSYLEPEGACLLLISSFTKPEKVYGALDKLTFQHKVIDQQRIFFEDLLVVEIKKSALLKEFDKLGIQNVQYLANGKRGYIHTGDFKGHKVSIKSTNPKSEALNRIEFESKWLQKLNEIGIGPKLITVGSGFFMYHYLSGYHMDEFLEIATTDQIKTNLRKLLKQLYELDKLGINKEEMHRPIKNVLISLSNGPVLIDFERANYTEDPKNITQFCQFLASSNATEAFQKKNITISKEKTIELAKSYKQDRSEENFSNILALLD